MDRRGNPSRINRVMDVIYLFTMVLLALYCTYSVVYVNYRVNKAISNCHHYYEFYFDCKPKQMPMYPDLRELNITIEEIKNRSYSFETFP